MAIYKRGRVYWYEFIFDNKRVRRSAKTSNKRAAENIEAAYRTKLAERKGGIVEQQSCNICRKLIDVDNLKEGLCQHCRARKEMPTLREFGPRFVRQMEVHCKSKPRTLEFWKLKLSHLLEYKALADCPLDRINKALVDSYIQSRHDVVSLASINRELSTLTRLLYLALEWKVIESAPRIRKLKGERERARQFVLTHSQEPLYLAKAPQPLHDIAVLLLDTGLRLGEALQLEWRDIHLEPGHGARLGYLHVRSGKSANARRTVSLTARVTDMLASSCRDSKSDFVFSRDDGKPLSIYSLDQQHAQLRSKLNLPSDFVLHSMRHTFLTRFGEAGADVFTIKKVAGHSSVTVSERYVHPTPEGQERAFERLENLNHEAAQSKLRVA